MATYMHKLVIARSQTLQTQQPANTRTVLSRLYGRLEANGVKSAQRIVHLVFQRVGRAASLCKR